MQGSGLKQSSAGKARGSHMCSLKMHKIITCGFSKMWHCMCEVSDTGVPYTKTKLKIPYFYMQICNALGI